MPENRKLEFSKMKASKAALGLLSRDQIETEKMRIEDIKKRKTEMQNLLDALPETPEGFAESEPFQQALHEYGDQIKSKQDSIILAGKFNQAVARELNSRIESLEWNKLKVTESGKKDQIKKNSKKGNQKEYIDHQLIPYVMSYYLMSVDGGDKKKLAKLKKECEKLGWDFSASAPFTGARFTKADFEREFYITFKEVMINGKRDDAEKKLFGLSEKEVFQGFGSKAREHFEEEKAITHKQKSATTKLPNYSRDGLYFSPHSFPKVKDKKRVEISEKRKPSVSSPG